MKRLFLLIATMGLVVALAACGNEENEPATETNEVEDTEVVEETEEDNTDPSETEDMTEEDSADPSETDEMTEDLAMVSVDLMDAEGNSVGTAELTEEDNGVRVKVNASDLPEGPHGFHFHETGKCEGPAFESAGGHFNPTGTSHGLDHEEGPHAGDLPNLEVGEDGTVDEEFVAEMVTLKTGEENSLLKDGGTALIIHADADDGTSQPSGDAGDRIVCGEIQ